MVDPRSITLAWSAPSLKDRNGDIRQYLINITEIDTGNSWQVTAVDSFTTVESLHPFYSYSIIVAAETVALGPFTSPIIVEMPEDGKIDFESMQSMCILVCVGKLVSYSSQQL